MEVLSRAVLVSALFVAGACSGSLAANGYRGAPLLTLHGASGGSSTAVDLTNPAGRLGLFWSPQGTKGTVEPGQLTEQPSNDATIDLPGFFQWSLYDPPPAAVLARTTAGLPYALGFFFVYRDANGNGQWDAGEDLLASSPPDALLFAPQDFTAETSPFGRAMPAGYRLVSRPISCAPVPPPGGTVACDVPLGAACVTNADCGSEGECLNDSPFPWPEGYCAIANPPADGCHPVTAALLVDHMMGTTPESWFVQACQDAADCTRPAPYQCDLGLGACLPSALLTLNIGPPLSAAPICAPSKPMMGPMGP